MYLLINDLRIIELQTFKSTKILKLLKNVIDKKEIKFIKNNVTYYSSEGMIYPLKKSNSDFIIDSLITASSKHSAGLLKTISTVLRPFVDSNANIIVQHYYYLNEIKEFYKHRNEGYLDDAIEACLCQIEIAPDFMEEFRTGKIKNEEEIKKREEINKKLSENIQGDDPASNVMRRYYNDGLKDIERLKNKKPIDLENNKTPVHTGYKQLCIIYEKMGRYKDVIELAERAKAEKWNEDWDKRIEKNKIKMRKSQFKK